MCERMSVCAQVRVSEEERDKATEDGIEMDEKGKIIGEPCIKGK